jgi:hypothetical protein
MGADQTSEFPRKETHTRARLEHGHAGADEWRYDSGLIVEQSSQGACEEVNPLRANIVTSHPNLSIHYLTEYMPLDLVSRRRSSIRTAGRTATYLLLAS